MYYDIMRQMIREGGDTDTNCCIVGGMIGALLGLKNIPAYMVNKVLNFDCTTTSKGIQRDDFLSAKKYAVQNIKKLIEIRPQGNLVI